MPPIFRVSFPSFFRRTTLAFNKHVIRKKTAGSCITDGAVLGISEEGTTHADGSLFQHLVMHIAQNLIPMLNNQYKQYRCYSFFKHSFLHNMHLSTHNTHLCLSHMFRWTVMVYVINVSSFRPHSLTIILPAISKWKNNNQSLTIKKHFFFFFDMCHVSPIFLFSEMVNIYYTQNFLTHHISYTCDSLIHVQQQVLVIYEVEKSLIYKEITMYILRWLLNCYT